MQHVSHSSIILFQGFTPVKSWIFKLKILRAFSPACQTFWLSKIFLLPLRSIFMSSFVTFSSMVIEMIDFLFDIVHRITLLCMCFQSRGCWCTDMLLWREAPVPSLCTIVLYTSTEVAMPWSTLCCFSLRRGRQYQSIIVNIVTPR